MPMVTKRVVNHLVPHLESRARIVVLVPKALDRLVVRDFDG